MKKISIIALTAATLLLSSCITSTKTATTMDIHPSVRNVTVADLDVAPERITYRMVPSKAVRRGGIENVKQAAENEALQKNGNADILIEPQFVYAMKNGKVRSIEVTGRPAYYTNFRSLSDTVWTNPVFNGMAPVVAGGGNRGGGFFGSKGGNFLGALGGMFGGKSGEKAEKPQKQRNPYRQTGFKTYLDFGVGLANHSGSATYFAHSYDDWRSGSITFGAQLDEQLYVGLGAGVMGDDNHRLNDEERSIRDAVGCEWQKYEYTYVEDSYYRYNERYRRWDYVPEYHNYSTYEHPIDSGHMSRIENSHTYLFIPIYLNGRYFFSPKKVSGFVDLKLGYSIMPKDGFRGGIYFSPSIGFAFSWFDISLKYTLQSTGYSGKLVKQVKRFLRAQSDLENTYTAQETYTERGDEVLRRNRTVNEGTAIRGVSYYDTELLNDFTRHTGWLMHSASINIGFRL